MRIHSLVLGLVENFVFADARASGGYVVAAVGEAREFIVGLRS